MAELTREQQVALRRDYERGNQRSRYLKRDLDAFFQALEDEFIQHTPTFVAKLNQAAPPGKQLTLEERQRIVGHWMSQRGPDTLPEGVIQSPGRGRGRGDPLGVE